MLNYKIDIIQALKECGYTTYRIKNERLISQTVMQKLRTGDTSISTKNIDTLCKLLNCQPGDILEYVPDKE